MQADPTPQPPPHVALLAEARAWLIKLRNYAYLAPNSRHQLEALIKSIEDAIQ